MILGRYAAAFFLFLSVHSATLNELLTQDFLLVFFLLFLVDVLANDFVHDAFGVIICFYELYPQT